MSELVELCKIMVSMLDQLHREGSITKEEYEQHINLKKKFIEAHKGMV